PTWSSTTASTGGWWRATTSPGSRRHWRIWCRDRTKPAASDGRPRRSWRHGTIYGRPRAAGWTRTGRSWHDNDNPDSVRQPAPAVRRVETAYRRRDRIGVDAIGVRGRPRRRRVSALVRRLLRRPPRAWCLVGHAGPRTRPARPGDRPG